MTVRPLRVPRRTAVLGSATALAAALMTACSSGSAETEAAAGGGAASDAGGAAGATRSVVHARGTTAVPEDPQRVVVLEPLELDTAVGLGVTPVGAAVAGNITTLPEYLGVTGVAPVGTVPEPDLEAIAALAPDLVLGTETRHAKLYDQLASIAPTVFIADHAAPWRENMGLIAEALGRSEEAADLLEAVDARSEEIAAEHAPSGTTVNMVRPRDETTLSLYGPTSFAGSLLASVGLSIPEREWADAIQSDISPENILEAQADLVLVTTTDVEDPTTIPAAIAQNAEAFPDVRLVDTSYWVSGVGPVGAQRVLDDIEAILADRS
ncbi:iron ABC transporter substrate-binding protein [Brachybacterium phenoliresistens]|uniref:Iron ABC transporter substrate-binding protein n=1 Tax=Brachybacterium phenoliresistens TaxID=396014 RepID=Z9JW83_9MICO|nr:iron-siderophore ABC transporter substrate-binding protein [Brachybacterium phenoliresistens]EWS82288.1 iron ABC transporter substrate-binding protein [Brachybacterium phenoliresistens]